MIDNYNLDFETERLELSQAELAEYYPAGMLHPDNIELVQNQFHHIIAKARIMGPAIETGQVQTYTWGLQKILQQVGVPKWLRSVISFFHPDVKLKVDVDNRSYHILGQPHRSWKQLGPTYNLIVTPPKTQPNVYIDRTANLQ